jgi:hypothetical protein
MEGIIRDVCGQLHEAGVFVGSLSDLTRKRERRCACLVASRHDTRCSASLLSPVVYRLRLHVDGAVRTLRILEGDDEVRFFYRSVVREKRAADNFSENNEKRSVNKIRTHVV